MEVETQEVNGVIPVPPVQVAYTAADIDAAVARCFAARPIFVGLDIEYRPTFQKDVRGAAQRSAGARDVR